ncbi:hypothetical protein [Arthrobacter sp. I3]|uniref:hypothetical protein n=1 Tax=Arthrobacter sp. I3 TaxID=218158 RepID=UPI0004B0A9B7|nr:hypothetical protein [Arthrobacter sp. I3]
MLSLIVVAMVTVAAGFVVWANDKRHQKYGVAVPAGVAASVGMLSWIIFIAAGFGYQPGLGPSMCPTRTVHGRCTARS